VLDEDSDEEQNSDSLDDVSSDDDELFEPDNDSEFDDDDLDDNDLDEDNLDEAKIEALFAPTTRRAGGKRRFPSLAEMRKSCNLGKADFIAFIEVEKLMIKRKWSLRHIILLYTRFGMATRRVRGLSHYSAIKRLATRFYDTQILVALLSFLHRRFGASGSDSSITMTSHSQKLGILTLLGC